MNTSLAEWEHSSGNSRKDLDEASSQSTHCVPHNGTDWQNGYEACWDIFRILV